MPHRGSPAPLAYPVGGRPSRAPVVRESRPPDAPKPRLLDIGRSEIAVRSGKGNKDRLTMLPAAIKTDLVRHLDSARDQHQIDLQAGAGWVELPWALGTKYPNAGREGPWQWAFPATRIYVDRLNGQRRRHHLHESVLQRAVKTAALRSGVAKRVSCHTFRHSFARP